MAVASSIKEMMARSSWIRKMFETGNELRKKYGAENVFDFSLGNPNVLPPPEVDATLKALAGDTILGKHAYMPNAGYPDVRTKVAEYASREQEVALESDNIIMTCGASGGVNVIIKTILNPGDEILVSTPFFMEYTFYLMNHGGTLVTVPGKENFEPDLEAIEAAITKKTAAVIINSPNNPSGQIYSEATIKALGEMLRRKSRETGRAIYLISDEPYRKIVYDNERVPPVFKNYENSFTVTSYSKDLSIPGERIGWVAVHPAADDCENIINGMILSNRILGFVNAPALLQRTIGILQGTTVDMSIYQRKRDLICKTLKEIGYTFNKPKGAFYVFPKSPIPDDVAFVAKLQEQRILTVPGKGFGAPGYFRIAFCVDDRVIEDSIPGFEKALKEAG
jgi:aspartate aminotransferase